MLLDRLVRQKNNGKLRSILLSSTGGGYTELHDRFNFREKFVNVFLPRGYPNSVCSNYLSFCVWNSVSSVSGSICSSIFDFSLFLVLATQSLLASLGIGSGGFGSAGLNWVIKDGLGLLGGVIYTSVKSGRYDTESKKYRWISSLFLVSSTLIELSTPLFPSHFLLLASCANISKNVAWITLSGTKAQMHNSFCLDDNLADVTSKSGSQMTASGLIGTSLGIFISAFNPSIISSYLIVLPLSLVSLYGVYRSNLCVSTSSINLQRGELLLKYYNQTGMIASPFEIGKLERFVFGYRSVFEKELSLSSLITVIPIDIIEGYLKMLDEKKYAIYEDDKFHLWFSHDACQDDLIRGFYAVRFNEGVDGFVEGVQKMGWKVSETLADHNKIFVTY